MNFLARPIERKAVNSFLKKILGLYFLVLLIFITIGAWNQVGFHEGFNVGDWLINYEGGFVRRGLIGEILYLLAKLTGISPAIYLVGLQGIIFSVYFYFSWKILQGKADLVKYAFLIFSPFLFTFAINSQAGGYRKEIIYFAIISFLSYGYLNFDEKKFAKSFFVLLAFFPLVILTDELGVVILPVLCAIYWDKVRINKFGIFSTLPILLFLNVLVFLFVFAHHQVTSSQVQDIIRSIISVGYDPKGSGAIGALGASTEANMKDTFHSIAFAHYFMIYPIALLLVSIAYFPLAKEIRSVFGNRSFSIGFLGSVFLLIPVYVIANDWGRWTYILLVEFFFLILLSDKETNPEEFHCQWKSLSLGKFFLIVILLFGYSFFWYLPHVLEDGSDWKALIHNVPFLRS